MTLALVDTGNIDREAVLKALNLNPRDPKTTALLLVCERYGLDPLLKHMVLISGNPYITRDGYLTVAHRSGQFDGMEVLDFGVDETHWWAKVAVWRKDMSHPFTYTGRYPKNGHQKQYGPEMAIKCGEVMGLRRAFNVTGIAAADEAWDTIEVDPQTGEILETTAPAPAQSKPRRTSGASAKKAAEATNLREAAAAVKSVDPMGDARYDALKARVDALDADFKRQLLFDLKEAGINYAVSKDSPLADADIVGKCLDVIEERNKPLWTERRKAVFSALSKFDAELTKDDDARHAFIAEATGGATSSASKLTQEQADAIIAKAGAPEAGSLWDAEDAEAAAAAENVDDWLGDDNSGDAA